MDIDSIEDNELGAANERVSLLKEEESSINLSNNSTDSKSVNSVEDQIDALPGRTKLLNKNEENNRVRRETQRNLKNKYDREDKRTKTIKQSNGLLPDTAALQREIIVEGLSQTEQDYEAKLLYTRGKEQDFLKKKKKKFNFF